jgi:LEA14-like dessication related protein
MGCQPFQKLEYKGLSDLEFIPKSFVESKLAVKVHLFNPNKHSVTVKRLEAAIDVNGKTWSNYKLDSNFVIPGNAETSFPLVLTIKNSYLISGLSGLSTGKELPYNFTGKIKGTYRKITAEVPFTYSGSFSEKDIKL